MLTDKLIEKNTQLLNIKDVASKINLTSDDIILYGDDKAKVKFQNIEDTKKGKVILVTSINPTPSGEGKTTIAIGLHDALSKLNHKSILTLREPSLGPVFGLKGGATGGGYSQVSPSVDINLHFTGDFHAITSANNLISSCLDNAIFQGNELKIDINRILFRRCIDINDRALRNIKLDNRDEFFELTAASQLMAVLCLAKNLEDFRNQIAKIVVSYNLDNQFVTVEDLGIVDAVLVLMKDAIMPNLVQTLENNPVIIHGGPFANIAHGTNSVIALELARSLADYTVVEAGFGADLGAQKFFDIVSPEIGLSPSLVVIVITTKSLKYHGGVNLSDLNEPNLLALDIGLTNLQRHIDNIKKYNLDFIISLNKHFQDDNEEIEFLNQWAEKNNYIFDITTSFEEGSKGSLELANKSVEIINNQTVNNFKPLYSPNLTISEKIETVAKNIYGASSISYSKSSLEMLNDLSSKQLDKLNVCIAKTPSSFSQDSKLLGAPYNFNIHVEEININLGAGFVVVKLGSILTMPGLSKKPNVMKISFKNNEIDGI